MVRALSERRIGLAVIPIPGLALLALTGLAAWLLAGTLDVKTTCFALLGPVLGLMLGILVGGDGGISSNPKSSARWSSPRWRWR